MAQTSAPETASVKTPAEDLYGLEQSLLVCKKCPLAATRQQVVFGTGSATARLVLVGEAPGADEDAQGVPFVGRAGQLLTKILAAIGLVREEVYIANVLKCRPPLNRDPNSQEVEQCEPFLIQQLEIIRPTLILALGRIAGNTLLKGTHSLGQMREQLHDYHGIPLMVTYHPAALLRNPHWKKPAWEDMKRVRAIYRGENIDE
ncbi:MAG: uracil-DNA glycosylase [Candidatus Delongbacteria bacterium]|nr:uracil-DNA glycosylase [Candidatus Delongbacteria bacterium]